VTKPKIPSGEQPRIHYSKDREPLDSLISSYKRELGIPFSDCSFRVWLKTTPKGLRIQEGSVSPSSEDAVVDRPCTTVTGSDGVTRRLLTTDYTDVDGEWRLLRNIKSKIPDLRGEKECLEIIVELSTQSSTYYNSSYYGTKKDEKWPREDILQSWRKDLRVGDTVDAQDATSFKKSTTYTYTQEGWFEAIVTEVTPQGVKVHYR
jgi:hypothetical protein